ncbi:transporter [Photobacterium sp.]|uniref:transporter n=1 Tax=Photobacterium sp. TaxID=660 RepID=UPI00299DD1AF|nr:transporter [Photobacterium sp.]MDX1302192.1 transporter [Photobacterium sp.]
MSILKNKSLIALLTICSGIAVAAESPATQETEKTKRVQTVADIFEQPGVLTPRGSFVLDTSLSYTQNSSNSVSVVGYTVLPSLIVGLIEASDIDRTTMTFGLTGRYGITNRFEVEARIPWVYRTDSTSKRRINSGSSENQLIDVDGSGLGDIEAAFKYQFNMDSSPYWVGSLRFKSTTGDSPYDVPVNNVGDFKDLPTGSGFPSIEPGITMIMPIDPAVIYMNLGYIWNIKDDVSVDLDIETEDGPENIRVDTIDLGDTISFSAGMGFAVNPKFSFSIGLNHKTILKSKVNGATSSDAKLLQLDSLSFGANYALNRNTTINVGASAGLTADAPDFQLTVRVPYTLKP